MHAISSSMLTPSLIVGSLYCCVLYRLSSVVKVSCIGSALLLLPL